MTNSFGLRDVGVRSPAGSEVIWCFGASPEKVIDAVTELMVLQRNEPETWNGEIFIRSAPYESEQRPEKCLDDSASKASGSDRSGGKLLHLPVPGRNRPAEGGDSTTDSIEEFRRQEAFHTEALNKIWYGVGSDTEPTESFLGFKYYSNRKKEKLRRARDAEDHHPGAGD